MYGYIYMFTNRMNGKRYIGQHIGDTIDENYFGSGVIFGKAKEKYGIENFKFDILCFCKTKEELDNAEKHFIGFEYYTFANTGRGYNVADGGHNGNVFIGKTDEEMEEIKKKLSEAKKGKYTGKNNPMYGVHRYGENSPFYGKHHSEEIKKKISEAHKGLFAGENHPMYGRGRKVICIETGQIFNCIREAQQWLGKGNVKQCCQGRAKTAGGYHWKYID